MINFKSLEPAIRKAMFTFSSEGAFHTYTVYALYQNPSRSDVAYTVSSDVFTAVINPILGKRVLLAGDAVEKFIIPISGNDFQLAATLKQAIDNVPLSFSNGSGLIKDADISADDPFAVLESYQVASNTSSSLDTPITYIDAEKACVNYYPHFLGGPIANISHILYKFSEPDISNSWAFPTDVYGLTESTITNVPIGFNLKVTVKPYLRIQDA